MYVVTELLADDAKIIDVCVFHTEAAAMKHARAAVSDEEFHLWVDEDLKDAYEELDKKRQYQGRDVTIQIWNDNEIAQSTEG